MTEYITVRLARLNSLCDKWKEFDGNYFIGDDGYIYRRLKSSYYRAKKYDYRQTRGPFGAGAGKQYTIKNHRATALAFVPNPEGLSDIDHINNDKTDNRAENLQWLSHKDNAQKREKDKLKGDE